MEVTVVIEGTLMDQVKATVYMTVSAASDQEAREYAHQAVSTWDDFTLERVLFE